jgi:hypothetical protein
VEALKNMMILCATEGTASNNILHNTAEWAVKREPPRMWTARNANAGLRVFSLRPNRNMNDRIY